MLFASLAAFTASWSGMKAGAVTLADVFLIAASIAGFVAAINFRAPLPLRAWMFAPGAVGLIAVARDVIVAGGPLGSSSIDPVGPALLLVRILFSTTLVAVVIAMTGAVFGRAGIGRLGAYWVAGAVASGVFSIAQSAGFRPPIPGLDQVISDFTQRYSGFASHPNALAQSCAIALPLIVYAATEERRFNRFVGLLGLPVAVVAIVISGSRAGLIVGLVALALAALSFLVFRKLAVWLLPIGITAAIVLAFVLPPLLANTRLSGTDSGAAQSDVGRLAAIGRGWELFVDSPILGTRMGAWYGEFSPLVLLAGGGLLLFAAYFAFVFAPTRATLRAYREPFAVYAVIATIGVLGFALLNNGMFERFTFWPTLLGWAWATFAQQAPVLQRPTTGADPVRRRQEKRQR